MKFVKNLFVLYFLLTFSMLGYTQKLDYSVLETKVIKLGTTDPVTELLARPITDKKKRDALKSRKQAPDNFKGRGGSLVKLTAKEHQGIDPLRQVTQGSKKGPLPIVNIDGLSGQFVNDPTGNAGTTQYVQAINASTVAVYDKQGGYIEEFTMNTLWSEFGISGQGDPIVLFDKMSNRWFLTEFAFPATVLIAVSETDDALGSYTAYKFTTPNFPDYPKYAMWPNALVFTSNESGPNVLHNYFIQRDSLLAGADNVTLQRIEIDGATATEAGFFVSTPIDFSGGELPQDSLPMVVKLNDSSWGNVSEDQVELFSFDIDWENEDSTVVKKTEMLTTPFDSYPCSVFTGGFSCIPQKTGGGLDGIPEVIMNVPQYRNFGTHESIVMAFITDVTDGDNVSGIRWMEVRRSEGEEWSLYQEGSFSPEDNMHRWMPSISMDKDGNIAMGYNVSSPNDFVGIRYTGRLASDPLGEMTFSEIHVVDGKGPIMSGARFGDYSHMSLDPVDGSTFWFTTEYAGNEDGGSAFTRITAFKLEKNQIDAQVNRIIAPVSGDDLTASEQVTVEIENRGVETLSGINIGFGLDGTLVETLKLTEELTEGSRYTHTFDSTIDLSNIGDYELKAFVNIEGDESVANDTITELVQNIAAKNVALIDVEDINTCNSSRKVTVMFHNIGLETITNATFDVHVNGLMASQIPFNGSVKKDDIGEINVAFNNLVDGENLITIVVDSLNGGTDQVSTNDTTRFVLNLSSDKEAYTLRLKLDDYPQETSWVLQEDGGGLIANGSGYSSSDGTIIEEFCLNMDDCYQFTIYDASSDGICCFYGQGGYSIIDADGNEIKVGGEFGAKEETKFCVGNPCTLTAEVSVTDAFAGQANGAIMIEANGVPDPFIYSIDGGLNYSTIALFEGLMAGEYDVVVTSSADSTCMYMETVEIKNTTSINEIKEGIKIKVSPNPGDGFYDISIENLNDAEYTMNMIVLDGNGKFIMELPLQKYSDVYRGQLSLVSYPAGIYYVKFTSDKLSKMERLIKI